MEAETSKLTKLRDHEVSLFHELETPYSAGKKKIAIRKLNRKIKAYQVDSDGELHDGSTHPFQLEFYNLSHDGKTYFLQHTLQLPFKTTTKLYQSFWSRGEVYFFSYES